MMDTTFVVIMTMVMMGWDNAAKISNDDDDYNDSVLNDDDNDGRRIKNN